MEVPSNKKALIVALNARIERVERDLARAAIAWLEVADTGQAEEETARSRKALGELWRRERLLVLKSEVMCKSKKEDDSQPTVYFLALDGCEPEAVPSFREWLSARKP